MRKTRRLNKEKLNTIVQCDYVVIDIVEYNRMIYSNVKNAQRNNEIYKVLNSHGSSREKIIKIRNIMQS